MGPAVVNTGAPGANRAECTTLPPPPELAAWAVVWSSNTASAHLSQRQKADPSSVYHHLFFNLCSLPPTFLPFSVPFPTLSALAYWTLRNRLQVKPDRCFELKKPQKTFVTTFQPFPTSPSHHDRLSNSPSILLVNNNSNKQLFLTAVHVCLTSIYNTYPNISHPLRFLSTLN